MLVAIDVAYHESEATAAAVAFRQWEDARPFMERVARLPVPSAYEPGAFYKRELPCLLAVLAAFPDALSNVLIDGYVSLGPDRPGLGMHLYRALGGSVAVIGVAKSRFDGAVGAVPVLRGASKTPLFVTAVGLTVDAAVEGVRRMHGPYRLPTLLKRADVLSRGRV